MSKKGFLLIEVILTTALVAGGLLIVMASFSVSKRLLYGSRELFQSELLLQEKIYDLLDKEAIEPLFQEEGRWKEPKAQWSVHAEPVPQTELMQINLEVSDQKTPDSSRSVETYLWKKSR